MNQILLKEKRFFLDEISVNDYDDMKKILQNEKLMLLGWNKTYSDLEVYQWIKKITEQYKNDGHSYYMIKDLTDSKPIGIVGLISTILAAEEYLEIAYIINENYQEQGFAVNSVKALVNHFSDKMDKNLVVAQFIPENIASKKVAEKLGMNFTFTYDRYFNNTTKKHVVYSF